MTEVRNSSGTLHCIIREINNLTFLVSRISSYYTQSLYVIECYAQINYNLRWSEMNARLLLNVESGSRAGGVGGGGGTPINFE